MRLIASFLVLAVFLTAQDSPKVNTFGMVGLAGGQTARLNLLNLGVQSPGAPTCLVSLVFLGDQGELLKTNTLNVGPARSVFLDLDADTDLALAANQRRQIRGLIAPIAAERGGIAAASACPLLPTLEIFDWLTGKTSIVMTTTVSIPQSLSAAPQFNSAGKSVQ